MTTHSVKLQNKNGFQVIRLIKYFVEIKIRFKTNSTLSTFPLWWKRRHNKVYTPVLKNHKDFVTLWKSHCWSSVILYSISICVCMCTRHSWWYKIQFVEMISLWKLYLKYLKFVCLWLLLLRKVDWKIDFFSVWWWILWFLGKCVSKDPEYIDRV